MFTVNSDKLTYFKSVNLFRDILKTFPGSVNPEIPKILNDGIPTEYIIRMFDNPFNIDTIITEVPHTLVLFANIVNEELYSNSGVQTDQHNIAMNRVEPASARSNPKRNQQLIAKLLQVEQRNHWVIMDAVMLCPEVLDCWQKTYFPAADSLYLSDFNSKFRLIEIGNLLPKIVCYLLVAPSKEVGDAKFFKDWKKSKKEYLQVQEMVSLYYTPDERADILLRAQLTLKP